MSVEIGDIVEPGEVVAILDTSDLELQITKSELSLESARASLAEKLQAPTDIEIKMANATIMSAKANVDDVVRQNAYALENAELSVENAKKNLDIAKRQTTSTVDQTTDNRKSLELDIAALGTSRAKTTEEYQESVRKADLALKQLAESTAVKLNGYAADLGETLDSLDDILEVENPNQVYTLTNYYSATDLTTREASKDAYRVILGRYRSEIQNTFPTSVSDASANVEQWLDTIESVHEDLRDLSDLVYR